MTSTRNRTAWIWVAIAAMAVATLARAQAGVESAATYTNPVLAFLTGQQDTAHAAPSGPQIVHPGASRKHSGVFLHDAATGAWTAMLPVLFIGLVAPLSLISPRFTLILGRTPAAPALPCRFQRPPPALLS